MNTDLYPRRWTRSPVRRQLLLPSPRRWVVRNRYARRPGGQERRAFWWRVQLDSRR